MNKRGGRRSTTWKPGWKLGKTKVIRIPEVLAEQLYEMARNLDEGQDYCLLQDKNQNSSVTGNNIEKAITVLEKSLKLPANRGGAIKNEIRKAITFLRQNPN